MSGKWTLREWMEQTCDYLHDNGDRRAYEAVERTMNALRGAIQDYQEIGKLLPETVVEMQAALKKAGWEE